MALRDYYGVLGVTPQASADDIRHAYRRLAKMWHPDRYRAAPEDLRAQAERRMRLLTEAHSILGDPGKRARYDHDRRAAGMDAPTTHGQPPYGGVPFAPRGGVNIPAYQPGAYVGAATHAQNGVGNFLGLIFSLLALALLSGSLRGVGYNGVSVGSVIAMLIAAGFGAIAIISFAGLGPVADVIRTAPREHHSPYTPSTQLDLSHFEELVRQAVDSLPDEFADQLANLAIFVEAEPGPAVLRKMGVKPGWTLFGLYEGIPLTKQGAYHAGTLEHITLYQGPIERKCHFNPVRIEHQVRATILHELAHHFGMDHDEMPIWVK